MRGGATSHRVYGSLIEAGLFLLLLGVPIAIGSVHKPIILIAFTLACFVLTVLWLRRRRYRVSWYCMALIGVTLFTAFQVIPLPINLLRWICPASVEVLETSMRGAGGIPNWHPISLDPSGTLWATIKMGACTMAFIVAHNYLYRRNRRNRIMAIFAMGAIALVLLGFVGAIVAPGKPLFFYTPEAGAAGGGLITTSFVNPNNAAAFLSLATIITIGLAVAALDLQHRILWCLAAVVLGAGVFLTLSIGGIFSFILGMIAFSIFLMMNRRENQEKRIPKKSALIIAIVAIAILGLAALLALDSISTEIQKIVPITRQESFGKLALWPAGWNMLKENPIVGVGRGTFLTTFPRYLQGDVLLSVTYAYLENQYLHLPIEWGIPIGGGIIVASLFAFIGWIRKSRKDPQNAALAAGIFAVAAHNLLDFNLEILGVALPIAIFAGALSSRKNSSHSPREKTQPVLYQRSRLRIPFSSGIVLIFLFTMCVFGIFVLVGDSPTAEQDAERITSLAKKDISSDEIMSEIQASIRRHPSDFLPHLTAGRLALRAKNPEALGWLNRSMFLFPKNPQIHLETAEALVRFKRRYQALLEYRLAIEHGASIEEVLRRSVFFCRNLDDMLRLLPKNPKAYAAGVDRLLVLRRLDLANELVLHALKLWPKNVLVVSSQISVYWDNNQNTEALEVAQTLAQDNPIPETYRLWAKSANRAEKQDIEIKALLAANNHFPKDFYFALDLGTAYLKIKNFIKAHQIVEQVLKQASQTQILILAHNLLAQIYQADGRPHRANFELEQAKKLKNSIGTH